MGFLKNIFKVPHSDILPNIVTLGGYGITKGSLQEAVKVVGSSARGFSPQVAAHPPALQGRSQGNLPAYNVTYGAPQYGAPQYGGGGGVGGAYDAYSYQPTFNPYSGGESWGSSTRYSAPSIMPYQAYSDPRADRSWEDLMSLAIPFFLL
jgi:hypothetical protein